MSERDQIHARVDEIEAGIEELPELEARLIELDGDPEDEVMACPWCGTVVLHSCHHDGQDVRSRPMKRREAADLKRREG